jgi:hypothetical protein
MDKAKARPIIFAYGFDEAGFAMPSEDLETTSYIIRFIEYRANQSLEEADGIIMPSGIFEDFKSNRNIGGSSTWVECDKDHLARREKEVYQNFRRGGWSAFLLKAVYDGNGKWEDTDLAKLFLKEFFHYF